MRTDGLTDCRTDTTKLLSIMRTRLINGVCRDIYWQSGRKFHSGTDCSVGWCIFSDVSVHPGASIFRVKGSEWDSSENLTIFTWLDGVTAALWISQIFLILNCVLFGRNVYTISINVETRRRDPLVYPCVQYLAFIYKIRKKWNFGTSYCGKYRTRHLYCCWTRQLLRDCPVCAGILWGKAAMRGDTIKGTLTVVQCGFCVVRHRFQYCEF